MSSLHDAIYALYPTVVTIVGETAYDAEDNEVTYDRARCDAYAQSRSYRAQRQVEYPALADQLDMLWHAIDSGALDQSSAFYTTLKAVKDRYPKT